VVSRTGTNIVRFAVAALLGLAACLVAWWPQSAAGSGDAVVLSPVAAAPTQKTPTPTATVAPTTAAPPPATPPATPTATSKPTKKPTRKPTTLHNNGGSSGGNNHSSGGSSTHHNNPPTPASTHSSAPYVPPPAPTTPAAHATKHTPSASTAAPTTAAPTTEVPTPAAPVADDSTEDAADAETYDTYLTNSAPVETQSAPVWVVPGILLVLTSMLALLGGVLGRGARPALARVAASDESDEPTES
jgi:hypothetical protein